MDLPDPAFRERLRAELFPRASLFHRLRLWLTGGRRPQLLAGGLSLAALVAVVAGLALATAGQRPASAVDGYVALVPRVLRAGETESVSLSLFDGDRLAGGDVRVAFRSKGETVLETSARIDGKGTIPLKVPQDAKGDYQIVVNGPGFTDTARVQVQQGTLLFLETDKPIYKPGQTILMRLVAMNSELKPVPAQATVEVQDAKAIKVFKQAGHHRRVRDGHAGAAAVRRAEPGRLEGLRPRRRHHHRGRRPRRGVRPPEVRGQGRPGEAVVPGRRADHGPCHRPVQLRQARPRRAPGEGLPLRRHLAGVRHLHRPHR